MEGTLMKRS